MKSEKHDILQLYAKLVDKHIMEILNYISFLMPHSIFFLCHRETCQVIQIQNALTFIKLDDKKHSKMFLPSTEYV